MGRKKTRWTDKENTRLNEFLVDHKEELISTLYKNIYSAVLLHRKRDFFFKEMSKKVKRSPSQCKSKFQKQEEKIYVKDFNVPDKHYDYFSFLRTQRQYFKTNKIYLTSDEITNSKAFLKWICSEQFIQNKKIREEILEEIKVQAINHFLNDEEISTLNFKFFNKRFTEI